MLEVVRETNWRRLDGEVDAVVDPRVRTGIQIGVQTVRKASGRRLTGV
jgi:hypothetical protein